MTVMIALVAGGASLVATAFLTWLVLRLLRRYSVVDRPNARSSHERPTPRGGGLAVIGVLLAAWLGLWLLDECDGCGRLFWVPLAGALVLAAVSWLDDLRGGLPPLPRFAVQVAAVGVGVVALPGEGLIFQGLLPAAIDHALAAIAWLWFVNLFNFMDGIDGISGTEAASIGLGVFALATLGTVLPGFGPLGLALAGVSLGFLIWNWNPAKIFLGDVGSVPLGFLAGWLLLALAAAGAWQAALLLPGYYLADATVTLLRRLSRGEKVWQAHREHFYQKVVIAGWSHARTSGAIGLANLALIGLALGSQLSVVVGWVTLTAGTILVMAFLWYLARRGSDIGSCGVSE